MCDSQPGWTALLTVWLTGGVNTGARKAIEYADTSVTAI